jgi:hypothetical protein
MGEPENKIISTEMDDEEGLNMPHHRRHHRHRIRVKQKIKTKKSSSKVKKKAKKYLTYAIWILLLIAFIGSIYLLIAELSKSPNTPLKDRRNRSEIIIKERRISSIHPLQS